MTIPVKKISTFCKTGSGGTPSRSNNAFFENGTIPWVKSGELKNRYITEVEEYITDLAVEKSSAKLVSKGSLLIAMYGATVGEVSQLTFDATTNQAICNIQPDENVCDVNYLYRFLEASKPYLLSRRVGGGQPNISQGVIKDLVVPLPPLAEQRRIASILDQADELRQKRQQAIEKLDQLLQATFIDMFGDPVSNPKGWERVSAKNVLKIQGGFAFSSTDFSKSGIPVVKIGNANKLGFSTEKFDFIIPQYPEKLTQYELRSGDLLMSLTGTVGKDDYGNITEVTDDYDLYYLNQRVAKLEVINTLFSKNYIRYFFSQSSIKALITKSNRGVRQANISNSDLYELDIPLPTKAQLDKFDSFIESINETKRYSKVQLISSNKLFFALQNQAFNGTL
jgi:type I restriction enzyme, S subunit